jgi:hypothetical protein
MRNYRIQVWTGPALVKQLAEKMRQAELDVVCEGTEHVYLDQAGSDAAGAVWNVLAALCRMHATDFGLRPKALFTTVYDV